MPSSKNIYRKESLDSLPTSEQFTDYIHQAKLKWWLITLLLSVSMLIIAIWAFVARIPVVVTSNGIVREKNTIACFIPIENLAGVDINQEDIEIKVNGIKVNGAVSLESQFPLSINEAAALLQSDWLFDSLISAPFSFHIVVRVEENDIVKPGTICNVALTTGSEAPIMLLTK